MVMVLVFVLLLQLLLLEFNTIHFENSITRIALDCLSCLLFILLYRRFRLGTALLLLTVLLFNRLLSMSFFKFLRFNRLKRDGLSISNIALFKNCCCDCPSSSSNSPWKLINYFNRLSTNPSSSILLTFQTSIF